MPLPRQEDDERSGGLSQAADEILAELGGGGGSGPQPIGVSPTFRASQSYSIGPNTRRPAGSRGFDLGGGSMPSTVAPRYFEDDEYAPANFNDRIIRDLQQQMAFLGLYDANASIIPGDWGEETASAFRRLLAYSNQHGMSYRVALAQLKSGMQAGGGRMKIDEFGNLVPANQAAQRAPLVTRTTDPKTLELVFRETSMNLLGQALAPDQIQMMSSAYNQMEIQRQQEAYDKQLTGGSVVDIPSPEAFGQAQVEEQNPQGVAQYRGVQYLNDAMQMLASPAWGI